MSKNLPEELKKVVSRGVIVVDAPHHDSKIGYENTHKELLFSNRPATSKIGEEETALVGGKPKVEDLPANFDIEDSEQLELIYKQALIRELGEELGEEIQTLALAATFYFIGLFENDGWQSAVFVTEFPEKPRVDVKPDSAGTLWISETKLREEKVKLFADHQTIVKAAFAKLDEIRARHENQDE